MASGVAVVVKRARDMNHAPDRDAFDAAMRRLGATRHANLLPPLAYHYRSDEKLVVHEYIPKGSLLFVLHGDRDMDYAALDWPARLKVAAGVARGTAFLHTTALPGHHDVPPHGNLKSANVLLAPDLEPLLVDCGLSGLASPRSTFASRAPECATGRQGRRVLPRRRAPRAPHGEVPGSVRAQRQWRHGPRQVGVLLDGRGGRARPLRPGRRHGVQVRAAGHGAPRACRDRLRRGGPREAARHETGRGEGRGGGGDGAGQAQGKAGGGC
jgi:serine/threonine protein kinase